jgi:hypothetical protein
MNEEKKIWRVEPMVGVHELEDELNRFANDGYQIHSIQANDKFFAIVAFDPTQIMKKQAEDMQTQMAALMGNISMPQTPGGIPIK